MVAANLYLLFHPTVQRANFEVENITYWEEPGEEEEEVEEEEKEEKEEKRFFFFEEENLTNTNPI